ncbi:unnamed protein product [Polarella glacialis]|uniref:Protein C10 n=1 Tax=Polarella glacialis TaxID=89957 RepID=A0A813KLK8_POLGL|nr:unnamed protein product [Polarella glacialis]
MAEALGGEACDFAGSGSSVSSSDSLPDLEPVILPPDEEGEESFLFGPVAGPHLLRLSASQVSSSSLVGCPWDASGSDNRIDASRREPSIYDIAQGQRHEDDEVGCESRRLLSQPCNDDICEKELGYPCWPDEMKDPDYFRKELLRMRNDPRHNPNIGKSMEDQEFWNVAARLPWAKVLLRKEQFWTERRNSWLQQYSAVLRGNRGRKQLAQILEDECSVELRRLVAPVLQYRVVEQLMLNILEESMELGLNFQEFLGSPGTGGPELLAELQVTCRRLTSVPGSSSGQANSLRMAALMQEELDGRLNEAKLAAAKEREAQLRHRPRTIIDIAGLKVALDFGEKCKQDGFAEWKLGNWEEALISWSQGDNTLRRFRAAASCDTENNLLRELHGATLRNLAQAALQLDRYGQALDAADRAIELGEPGELAGGFGSAEAAVSTLHVDVKAWYRRCKALEGLGRLGEAAGCLRHIEEASVGRPDGERLRRDCDRCRQHLQRLILRQSLEQGRMLRRGLRCGVFGSSRGAQPAEPEAQAPEVLSLDCGDARLLRPEASADGEIKGPAQDTGPANESCQPPQGAADRSPDETAAGGPRITRDGAWDLLYNLEAAYTEPSFVQRVDKLSRDLQFRAEDFAPRLAAVALEAQRPILQKWGFEDSVAGAQGMRAALQEHTRSPLGLGNPKLKELADKVSRGLYGSPELQMYDRVRLLVDRSHV